MIGESLKSNTTLTELNLGCDEMNNGNEVNKKMMINDGIWIENNIGDEGARMISESLKSNTALTTLDLGGDEMDNGKEV